MGPMLRDNYVRSLRDIPGGNRPDGDWGIGRK